MDTDAALERLNYFNGSCFPFPIWWLSSSTSWPNYGAITAICMGGRVSGLKVTIENDSKVVVAPGVAIDCAGNEIHVSAQSRLRIPKKSKVCFVVLQYAETEASPYQCFGCGYRKYR